MTSVSGAGRRTAAAAAALVGLVLPAAVAAPGAPGAAAEPGRVERTQAAAQTATLDAPSTVRRGTRVRLTARFRPVRPGRPVRLQVLTDARWRPVAAKEQDRDGVARFRVRVTRSSRFRAVAGTWRGLPAVRTRPVRVAVRPAPGGPTPWVTGYYAGWFWDQMYPPQKVDMDAMTHFVFGRVAPGAGSLGGRAGEVVPGAGTAHHAGTAPDGSGRTVEDYLVDRAHRAGTKALLMLGGDGFDGRGFMLSTTDARRAEFVENVVDYLVAHDYDGFAVDWENCLNGEAGCGEGAGQDPVPAEEARRRVMALIADIRAEAATRQRYDGTPLLVTFPGYPLNINFLDDGKAPAWQARIANAVDQYNLMTYGVGTTWWGHGTGWHSWFSGALTGARTGWPVDIASSIAAYEAAGVPAARLGIGIGFYGIYYGPEIDGPREYDRDNDIYEVQDAALGYAELVRKGYLSHGRLKWDRTAKSTYRLYGGPGYVPRVDPGAKPAGMLSYEDPRSIAAKGAWVERHGVGGTIIWTLNYGYLPGRGTNPLLDATAEAFLGR